MAKDDYSVIVYYLLSYLYGCLKKGLSVQSSTALLQEYPVKLPESYVVYILDNTQKEGLIRGAEIFEVPIVGTGPTKTVRDVKKLEIAPEGIRYLTENSTMARAKEVVKDTGGVLAAAIQAFL